MAYIDKDKALNLDFRINVSLFESRRKTAERAVQAYADAINAIPAADVRPVVVCADCKHNNACLTQAFVEDESKVPFDRNTFFCADGKRADEPLTNFAVGGERMRYTEAIMICDKIDLDSIGGREIDTDTKLDAIQKILSMETINAVKKETLVKVIRWFWKNCVDVEANE